ncbi:hypothetical protein ACFX16_038501 [Malus domestica]
MERPHKNQYKIALRKLSQLEIFFFSFFADTSSVGINSTVEATGDILSRHRQLCHRRVGRSRSIFRWHQQHCGENGRLPIQVSVEKGFRILVGRGHLISLLGEVRCYSYYIRHIVS